MERGKQWTSNGSIAAESNERDSVDYPEKGKRWNVGNACRAYCRLKHKVLEAKIMFISIEKICLIGFLGYDHYGEIVHMKRLQPSEGKLAQENQIMDASNDKTVQQQMLKIDSATKSNEKLSKDKQDEGEKKIVQEQVVEVDSAIKSNKKLSKDKRDKGKKWVAGDSCRAVYYADGKLYEAEIVELYSDGTCRVCFVGYGNEQVTSLKDLRPSKGKSAQENQMNAATNYEIFSEDDVGSIDSNHGSEEWDVIGFEVPHTRSPAAASNAVFETASCEYIPSGLRKGHIRHHHSSSRKSHPPELILSHRQTSLLNQRDGYGGNEALSARLMSWYIAGYRAGFRKGFGQRRSYNSCDCSRHH